jgi:hypothetical protein
MGIYDKKDAKRFREIIDDLRSENERLTERIAELEAAWVPVTERLPEKRNPKDAFYYPCRVEWTISGRVSYQILKFTGVFINIGGYGSVIEWLDMPLPAPEGGER